MSELVNVETLDELLSAIEFGDNVVVVFSARDWCVPCQRLHPHVIAAAKELRDYKFIDVDIDKHEDIKNAFDIMKVPTILFYAAEVDAPRNINAQTTAVKLVADLKS